jgi:3',5'-cyclic AMP phosphodiesterase CpdA
VLHLSDLHVGAHDEGREVLEQAVAALVGELEPELVVCSGDLTHRNRPEQHARAAAFLRSLGPPVLAVPGNHDMPMLPPARLMRTFGAFRRVWGDDEPVYRSELLHVVGLNSARGWLYQEGVIRAAQLRRVAEELAEASSAALRVVVLHHHLCSAPWRTAKRPVFRRSHAITALARAGADLVLSGHVHQSSVYVRSEFEAGAGRPMVIVNAPGLGRPRAHRQGEAAGLHVYVPEAAGLRVLTYAVGASLERVADRLFPPARALRAVDGGVTRP